MKCNVESMGWFGLTWQEKVAKFTYDETMLTNKGIAKKLKDFLQPGGFNTRLIENIHREYSALMAKNYKPALFKNGVPNKNTLDIVQIIKDKINADEIIVLNFLRSLQNLAAAGTIPFAKWNPSGYAESTALQKTFDSEKTIFDKAQGVAVKASKASTVLLILAGLGLVSYVVYETKRR